MSSRCLRTLVAGTCRYLSTVDEVTSQSPQRNRATTATMHQFTKYPHPSHLLLLWRRPKTGLCSRYLPASMHQHGRDASNPLHVCAVLFVFSVQLIFAVCFLWMYMYKKYLFFFSAPSPLHWSFDQDCCRAFPPGLFSFLLDRRSCLPPAGPFSALVLSLTVARSLAQLLFFLFHILSPKKKRWTCSTDYSAPKTPLLSSLSGTLLLARAAWIAEYRRA